MHHPRWILKFLSSKHRTAATNAVQRAVNTAFEQLESRRMYSVTASAAAGVLTVIGDDNANVITVSRDLAGNLRIDSGAVAINGSPATVANIQSIRVSALGGNDNVKLDETNGALPPASLSGGNGNDTLTGGSGADTLNGDDGDDVLLGKAGNDLLFGGNGNDTLTGGAGIDRDFGQAGNDRMIWNGGDGSDLNEGGDGSDTVEVNGGDASESFRVGNVLGRVHFERVDPAPFTLDIGTTEKVVLNANGGDDTFSGGTNLAALTSFVVNGGVGKDTLLGTDGADTLNGGDGKDFVDGNAGKDVALLGSGDDTFQWDPGDGSDVVEGQTGTDLLLFNGAPAAENMALSNNAGRLLLTRDLGTISMDVNGVESVQINALAGVDNITVHNLAGTAVKQLNLNLEGIPGKGAPDGQTDSVLVEGTNGDDVVTVAGRAGGDVSVTGLAATVTLRSADPTDKLSVHARGGNDAVIASGLDPTAMLFSADGGSGNDLLIGSAGNDTLTGGDGDDFLLGGAGTDQLDGGAGHNVLIQ